jgi:hypothetical protein
MRAALLVATVLVASGCLAGGEPLVESTSNPQTTRGSAPPVVATTTADAAAPGEDTGSVSVTVTTTELQPVGAAQVTIAQTELSAFTDTAGVAIFNGVAPGTYTVLVAKPGYQAQQDKGRVVEVAAGEVAEVKMVLNPIEVIDAATGYHSTFPLRGFISCAIEGQDGIVLNRATPCGDYIQPGGVQIGDPNHKSRFAITIDSVKVLALVVEGKWQPATGFTAQQLRMLVTHQLTCTAATCIWNDAAINVVGRSPLHGVLLDGADRKIVKRWGEDPAAYPKTVYAETGAYCKSNCTGVQIVFQQSFEKFVTVFYGREPPAGYTALPS